MKKTLLFFILLTIISFVFPFDIDFSRKLDTSEKSTFLLPSSLIEIEEEAFWGTAGETVVFPESLTRIGDNAFAESVSLTDVYIPLNTQSFSESTFPLDHELTIHGINGSNAQKWAREHDVRFVEDNIWFYADHRYKADDKNTEVILKPNGMQISNAPSHILTVISYRTFRPQDRPELHPIDYKFP